MILPALGTTKALSLREVNILFRGNLPDPKPEEEMIPAMQDDRCSEDPLGKDEEVKCLYFDCTRFLGWVSKSFIM